MMPFPAPELDIRMDFVAANRMILDLEPSKGICILLAKLNPKCRHDRLTQRSRAGGERGGSLAVVRKDNSANLSKTYKENSDRNFSKEEKEEYWEGLRKTFEPYWIIYPAAGRINYESCLQRFRLIHKSMPSPTFFCGYISYLTDNVWDSVKPGYVPMMLKFLLGEDWRSMDSRVKSSINGSLASWHKTLQARIAKYKEKSND
jgi:hypothetical protein